MHYSQHDPFHLADRLRAAFPVPGAADLRVSHVIYALHEGRYQWLLTVDYTQGVLRMQHRVRRAATFCEPHEAAEGRGCSALLLADAQLPLLQQYQELHRQLSGGLPPAHSSPGPEPSRMKTSR